MRERASLSNALFGLGFLGDKRGSFIFLSNSDRKTRSKEYKQRNKKGTSACVFSGRDLVMG